DAIVFGRASCSEPVLVRPNDASKSSRLLLVVDKVRRHAQDRVRRDLLDYCHRDALAMVRLLETLESLARVAPRCGRLGLTSPLATFSAHTAAPPPPSRTPADSRASSRHASTTPPTTWARGPLAWAAPRTRTHLSIPAPSTPAGASRLLRTVLTRLSLELLNG